MEAQCMCTWWHFRPHVKAASPHRPTVSSISAIHQYLQQKRASIQKIIAVPFDKKNRQTWKRKSDSIIKNAQWPNRNQPYRLAFKSRQYLLGLWHCNAQPKAYPLGWVVWCLEWGMVHCCAWAGLLCCVQAWINATSPGDAYSKPGAFGKQSRKKLDSTVAKISMDFAMGFCSSVPWHLLRQHPGPSMMHLDHLLRPQRSERWAHCWWCWCPAGLAGLEHLQRASAESV